MATTVLIPCRNEEKTIGKIVDVFNTVHETDGNVWVLLDADTTDDTERIARFCGAGVIKTNERGKGQVVATGKAMLFDLITDKIMLCDGDYRCLTRDHVFEMFVAAARAQVVIGIPDFPSMEVPEHVIRSWPYVSGFRIIPHNLIPPDAHGYLLETQINVASVKRGLTVTLRHMYGLKSPFTWPLSEKRMEELQRDREWGIQNGVL